MKTVYIATSTRNLETYAALAEVLVSHGFTVLDWRPNLPEPGPDYHPRQRVSSCCIDSKSQNQRETQPATVVPIFVPAGAYPQVSTPAA